MQLADNFTSALLVPKAFLDALIGARRKKDVGHLADVAVQLRAPVSALSWRLRALGRIDEATRTELARVRRPDATCGQPLPFSEPFVRELYAALAFETRAGAGDSLMPKQSDDSFGRVSSMLVPRGHALIFQGIVSVGRLPNEIFLTQPF